MRVTGIGSWPGTDMDQTLRLIIGECPQLPHLPELPDRGPHAQMVGRATAVLTGLGVDRQPTGWRLLSGSDAGSIDQRRARSLLAEDLDRLEEQAHGWEGPWVVSVTGPWTMAAAVELPRGGPVLSDHGATRELQEALVAGTVDLMTTVARRLPEATIVAKIDEPLMAAVARGTVPTASGWGTVPAIDRPDLHRVLAATAGALGEEPVLHSCADQVDWELVCDAGWIPSLDVGTARRADWDVIAGRLERGAPVWLGALATQEPGAVPRPDTVADQLLRRLRELEVPIDPDQVVLTPACGLAAWSQPAALRVLRSLHTIGEILTEQLSV